MRTALKIIFAGVLLVAPGFSQTAWAAETYYTDPGHTEVRFGWNHAGVSMQTAEFTKVDGMLTLDPDNVEKSKLSVTIDANSVSSGVKIFDKHLKGKRYFDVAKFPKITFVSTSVKRTGDKTADVIGDMTIHGVTKPVTLKTTLTHRGPHPVAAAIAYYKGNWVAFSATTKIDHMAFKVGNFSTGPITINIVTEMKDRKK
ncbi:MAG: polyisoprenoid-binding protein [Alphaproteobacteria bacterium]|nr:polyisoprenoid-binding protein [Alphaproteobacteria bacterium]